LTLSQTDQFDTPYNEGIPEAYHRQKDNHWHVTAETNSDTKVSRIAAVMAVTNPRDSFDIELRRTQGWLGVLARGGVGQAAGWICIDQGEKSPSDIRNDNIKLWGRDRDAETVEIH
jgi:hypothetical protein